MKKVDHVLACSIKKKKKEEAKLHKRSKNRGKNLKKAVKDLKKFSFKK